MPERDERLFWVQVREVGPAVASSIDAANLDFCRSWTGAGLESIACVKSEQTSDRLWLFRLHSKEPEFCTEFNKLLGNHISSLASTIGVPGLRAKRQVALPTPLVSARLGPWPTTDVGLHVVNDQYNGMLVTYTYHEGRYYNVPHLQPVTLGEVASRISKAWQSLACDCHKTAGDCCGSGCYECFQPDCASCGGTGWRDFRHWASAGCKVDYSSGLPMAEL